MSNEFNEKFENYISDLNTAIEKAQKEREKIAASDSKRKEKKLAKIDKIIDQLSELGSRANKLEDAKNDLLNLEKLDLGNDSEVIVTITNVIENLNAKQDEEFKDLKDKLGYTDSEILDVDEFKEELEKQIHELDRKKRLLSGKEYERAEEQLEKIESLMEAVNEYYKNNEINDSIISNLKDVIKFKTLEKKKACLKEAIKKMTEKYDVLEDQVLEDMETFAKIQKKIKVKEEKEEKDNWFKSHWKGLTATVVGVAVAAGLTASIIYLANKIDKLSNDDKDHTPSTSDTTNPGEEKPSDSLTEEEKQEIERQQKDVNSLIAKGYSEAKAKLIVANFDQNTVATLKDTFIPEVEKYANCKEFNLNYLEDYEAVVNKYQTTGEKAADYVNRSYKILATNYFKETYIEDIVEIVYAIDNKTLYTTDNVSVTSPIGAELNSVLENYIFGTPSEDDINKLEAFKYFAKEGSDLDKFFTRATGLYQDVLREPNNIDKKDNLLTYLTIYAKSLNGFEDKNALTDNIEFNEDAVLEKEYDFYIAYKAMVGPLEALMITDVNEEIVKPEIPENATQSEIDVINAQYELDLAKQELTKESYDQINNKAYDLMDLILSATKSNIYCNTENNQVIK